MIDITYNNVEEIISVTRTGEVTLQHMFNYIDDIVNTFKNKKELFILDDSRKSTSIFVHADYPAIINTVEKRMSNFKLVKLAILVDTPDETALSMLFEPFSLKVKNYHYKFFSTSEAAKLWLKA